MPDIEFADEPFDEDIPAPRIDREPRPTARPKKTTKTQTTPPYKQGALIEPITLGYGFLGMGFGILEAKSGKMHMPIGSAIVESAEKCAEAWDTAAKTSPAIRRVMYKLVGSSNLIMIAGAHAPIAVAVSNQIPAVQKLSRRVGEFLQNMVRVDDQSVEYAAQPDGFEYTYPDESQS